MTTANESSIFHTLMTIGVTIWRHASAVIALALIVLALFIGISIGRGSAPEEHDHADKAANTADSVDQPESAEPPMYTCSMHPTVRLPDPDAKCPICFMDLIPVTDSSSEPGSEHRITLSESAAALARIETTPVARFLPEAQVRLFGRMAVDETRVARLTAYFPGRLDRLFVNYVGVPVNRGDHLAEIYSPELLAAFEELRQSARAVKELENASNLVRESTEQTLLAAREKLRLFGLTEAQIREVESNTMSSDRFTIYAPLGGIVTQLGQREGDYVQTGTVIATVADLSRLWLDLEAYESQLPLLRWGQSVTFTVESQPGEVFRGQISFIEPMVDERTRTAAVRVAVENADRRLKPGMFATAIVRTKVDAHGAIVSDSLAGKWVGPMHPTVVRDEPGTCDVCGMDLVSAESLGVVGDPTTIVVPLVIPRSAVLITGARAVVYVRIPDAQKPTFEARDIQLGSRAGDFYVVRDGLEEHEEVVTNGAFRIDSSMQIAGKSSMMSPGGSGGERSGHAHGGTTTSSAGEVIRAPDSFIHALKPVYAAYFQMQESLAADDLAGYGQGARDLRTAIDLVRETGLVGPPLATWRRLRAQLNAEDTSTDIATARARFETASKAIIELAHTFGHHGSQAWQLAYCPMAFDNAGAEWLQRSDELINPYFGAAMLRCGEFRATILPLHARDGGGE